MNYYIYSTRDYHVEEFYQVSLYDWKVYENAYNGTLMEVFGMLPETCI